MALKTLVEKIEDVPESLREHYVKTDDGKYRLDGVEDVSGLKSALEKERRERAEAKAALAKIKDIDPEEYVRLKKDHDERETKAAERKGEWDKLRVQMAEKHTSELTTREEQIKAMRGSLETHLIDAEATRAIAAAKGVPELLLPHVRQHVRVVEEGGKYTAKVVDGNGNPRIGDAKGNPMSIDELVTEMRGSAIYGRAFEGTGASGSGAPSGGGGSGAGGKQSIKRADFDALDAQSRMDFMKSKGTVTD